MHRKFKNWFLRRPEGEGDAGGGSESTAATATTVTETTTATPAATTSATTQSTAAQPATTTPAAQPSESGYWPSDWREKVSKGDEKLTARFGRYQSPEAALTALIAAQNRITSGELKPILGKNPSAEEIKEYREAIGIPDTPEKYEISLGKGFEVAEEDKPFIDNFLKAAHETHQTPAQVNASLKAYYSINEQITAKRSEQDAAIQQESEDALRAEWGNEFKRNVNLISGLMDRVAGDELKNNFLGGRLADGTPIGSSPSALKFLVGLALLDNPAGTVVPNNGGNLGQSINDEITKIEKVMNENRPAYNKDEAMQARYRELLGARDTMTKRK